jgi:hypothetical protein
VSGHKIDWRTLNAGGIEARPSHADEQALAKNANAKRTQTARDELAPILANMTRELEQLRARLGHAVPGDHRGYLREIAHGLEALTRIMN